MNEIHIEEFNCMDSQFFIKIFNPYRGKYTVKLQYVHDRYLFDGYGNEWRTIYKPMKNFLIERAIRGITIIGWFTNTRPNVLGIDIDDHDGYAWEGVKASQRLLSIYDNILKIFPLPSIVVQSPRGIHLYYILDDRIPTDILQYLAKLKLKNIPCEIRPTTDLSLRIPEEKRILNPKTLLPIIINNELETYHPAFLFENEYLPGTLRQTLQERKCKLRSLKATAKLEQVEALYTPILPGQSNEALNNLIPIYKYAGLTEEESVYRMSMILQKSYLYKGELRKPKRLEQRVRSYYKRDIQKYVPKPKKLQLRISAKNVQKNTAH